METVRDAVIIVFGITATIAAVVVTLTAVLVFRKVDKILDSVHTTVKGVEAVVAPLARATALVASAWKILSEIFGDGEKKRRDDSV